MRYSQKIYDMQDEDDSVIGFLAMRVTRLIKENKALKATIARLRKNDLAAENERLNAKVKELEYLHFLDQSEIVRLRRTIGMMDGE